MAHKKGVGSSKNGRESAAQSSFVSVVLSTTQVTMLLWVRTILFTLWLMVL